MFHALFGMPFCSNWFLGGHPFRRYDCSCLCDSIKDACCFASQVSVNPNNYDVLTFWVLGRESPPVTLTAWQKLLHSILKRPLPTSKEYFKRVVLACRLKRDDKLLLKAFKEVPVNALEQTLPDGKVTMTKLDRGVINASLVIAATGILAKVVTVLAGIHVDWTLLATAATGLIGIQAWTQYKNKHMAYLNEHSRMMFFKNIANNRGLLTLLVDRAEDEIFKEALLAYSFLLTNRPPSGFDESKDVDLGKFTLRTRLSSG